MKHYFILLFLLVHCSASNKKVISIVEKSENSNMIENKNISLNTTLEDLNGYISDLKFEHKRSGSFWIVDIEGQQVIIVADAAANRMRIMTPIIASNELEEKEAQRLLQANFDSALDSRYAIAQEQLWSVFIHPLNNLDKEYFYSGLAQTITLKLTFRDSYQSGALIFGGGDSNEIYEKLRNKFI